MVEIRCSSCKCTGRELPPDGKTCLACIAKRRTPKAVRADAQAAPLDLTGFLPWPTDERRELVASVGCVKEAALTCKACVARGQTWNGSAPRCAFEGGAFGENWNCATVNAVRDIVYEGHQPPRTGVDYRYCDDQKYATVFVDDVELPSGHAYALWVCWYKSRGGTDALWLLDAHNEPRKPTEADCLAICAAYGVTP